MIKNEIINNLYVFQSSKKLKNLGYNNISSKFLKKIRFKKKINVNLEGDNLYKINLKMFNGIVYNQGIVKDIKKGTKYVSGSLVLEIESDIKFKKSDIGESVCCDGVCLTLIRIKKNPFYFIYLKKLYKDQILNLLKRKN